LIPPLGPAFLKCSRQQKGRGLEAAHLLIQAGPDARRLQITAASRSSNFMPSTPSRSLGFRNPAPHPAPVGSTMISLINDVNSAAEVRTDRNDKGGSKRSGPQRTRAPRAQTYPRTRTAQGLFRACRKLGLLVIEIKTEYSTTHQPSSKSRMRSQCSSAFPSGQPSRSHSA
jgi:hypothetical protein